MTAEGPSYLLCSSSGIREVFFFSRGRVYGQTIFTKRAYTRRPALAPTAGGDIVASYTYDEFGVLPLSSSGPEDLLRQTFVGGVGMKFEADSGFYYARQRWYNPSLGRFLTQDPVGTYGGLNLYAYVGNNPVNWVDPSGRYAEVTVNGNNVEIVLPIEFVGQGATTAVQQQFIQEIESVWSGQFGKYTVTTTVRAPNPACPDNKKNKILVYGKHLTGSSTTGPYAGSWHSNRAGKRGSPAAHEAGHSMGLDDKYDNVMINGKLVSVPKPGFKGNIMADVDARGPNRITEAQIYEITRRQW